MHDIVVSDFTKEVGMPKLMLLALEHLRTTKKKRRGVCPHRIEFLRQLLEAGGDIPPIRVSAMGDGTFVVKDGRHRIGAHLAAGMTQIWAIVENIIRTLLRKWHSLAFGHPLFGWLSFLGHL